MGGVRVLPFKLARSSVLTTAKAAARDFRPLAVKKEGSWRIESGTKLLQRDIEGGKLARENIVVVVVESLGEARDSALAGWIQAPLLSDAIRRRYQVGSGNVEFDGSTVFGELRELCGLRGVGMRVNELQASQTQDCLPAKLDERGYATVSVHGVTSAMFGRRNWYPTLGFQRMIFPENWPRANPRFCNAQFHAICDADAADLVRDELGSGPQPKFVYWLTAESHLQLNDSLNKDLPGDCKSLVGDVCWLVTTQRASLGDVARIALDPLLRPTRFVVVGDHSPPYMLRSKRDLFAERRVPWVELRPQP
jgi:hypothetical protein